MFLTAVSDSTFSAWWPFSLLGQLQMPVPDQADSLNAPLLLQRCTNYSVKRQAPVRWSLRLVSRPEIFGDQSVSDNLEGLATDQPNPGDASKRLNDPDATKADILVCRDP